MTDYWKDRCTRCGHIRAHHGEGGCTAAPSLIARVLGGRRGLTCGCLVRQSQIQR